MMPSEAVSSLGSDDHESSNLPDLKKDDVYESNQQCFKIAYSCSHETPDPAHPLLTHTSSCSDPSRSLFLCGNMGEPKISRVPVRCPACGEDRTELPATPRLRRQTANLQPYADILDIQNGDIFPVFEEVPKENVPTVFNVSEKDTSESGFGMSKIISGVAAMLPGEFRLPLTEEATKVSHVMKPVIKSTVSVLKAGAHELGRQIHQIDKAPILARLDEVQSSVRKTDTPNPLTTTIWNSFARTVVQTAKSVVVSQQRKDQWIDRAGDEDVDTEWDDLEDMVESDPEVLREKSKEWEEL